LPPLPPQSVIGILGGGQLGRMLIMAAARLGFRCHVYCQTQDEPAAQIAQCVSLGSFDDQAALEKFARDCDVVTAEWENVPVAGLQAIAAITPVLPTPAIMAIAQDRLQEKMLARSLGLGTADFIAIDSAAALAEAMQRIPSPAILKTRRMGYDGKGQIRITPPPDAKLLWQQIGETPAILEAMVDFTAEISVIVARGQDGAIKPFPVTRNLHQNGILAESHVPSGLPAALESEAIAAAILLAEKLDLCGLLAVEMFVRSSPDANGRHILINEIAPRPHNSGHWTMDACATSQFEQLVRAIAGLPLGTTDLRGSAVMFNLIGAAALEREKWLSTPNAHLHLYGKDEIREGRKMGHVTLVQENK
jgi:5-(carboxyamino)imidazole ribonucleotide synthase